MNVTRLRCNSTHTLTKRVFWPLKNQNRGFGYMPYHHDLLELCWRKKLSELQLVID